MTGGGGYDRGMVASATGPEASETANRPIKGRHLDPEVIRLAGEGARLGMKYELLAEYCGIAPSTLYKWLQLARSGAEEYEPFADAIRSNSSRGAAVLLARIHEASKETWQAAAWILERRHGYVARHEVTGAEGGPIEVAPALPLADRIAARLGITEDPATVDAANGPDDEG